METAVETHQKEGVNNVPEEKPKEKPLPGHEKKSKKEDRSKSDKNVDHFMKSLNSVQSLEEKFALVCKKYLEGAEETKKLQFYIKQSDKRFALLLKEKEQLQHEFNKTILFKSKLENLCRELQKQNKAIKEESALKIREEEERRKETHTKFQSTLSEITAMLQTNNEKNAKLRDDNISMSEKFKTIVSQYQLREQQVEKMAKQMALESQLSEAKLQKSSLEHQAERNRLLAAVEQGKMELAQSQARIQHLQGTEVALRSQINVYTDKYDEFQNALVKSNQMFGGFKGEMEKMSKKIQSLEKESLTYKSRWQSAQAALVDACGERQAREPRLRRLEALCRTLQAERTALLNTLKEHDIERPPLPAMPPPPPADGDKVEAMAANCVQLKESLANLQNQLNVLTNKNENAKPEKTEKKKSKSKKNKQKKEEAGQKPADSVEKKETDSAAEATESIKPETNGDVNKTEEMDAIKSIDDITNVESNVAAVATPTNVENIESPTEAVNVDTPIQLEDVSTPTNVENVEAPTKVVEVATPTKDVTTPTKVVSETPTKVVSETPTKSVNVETTTKVVDVATPTKVVPTTVEVKTDKNEVIDEHNSSFIESNPLEEISHIPEVKLIGQGGKK